MSGTCTARLGGRPWRFAWLALLVVAPFSCGGPQAAAGRGEECFRADDCEPGLVCIAGVCDDDLTKIVSQVDGPVSSDASAGGAGGSAGAAPDAPATGGAGGGVGASSGGAGGSGGGTGGAGGSTGGTGGGSGGAGGAGGSGTGGSGTGGSGTGGSGPGDGATE